MRSKSRALASAPVALALLAATFGFVATARAETEATTLRRLAQSKVEAGRLSGFRVVEPYHAVGASMMTPLEQAGEAGAAAKDFGSEFCVRASSERSWRRSWLLVVYGHGQSHRLHSCSIPLRKDSAKEAIEAPEPFERADEID